MKESLHPIISDIDIRVKEALDIWAEWQGRDFMPQLGYGNGSVFASGGSVRSWEDFEYRVEKNIAIHVQAIYEGLDLLEQSAISHFHLAAVWSSPRIPIEVVYERAIKKMTSALKRRGVV